MFEGFNDGDVVSAVVNIKNITKAKSKAKKDYIRLTLNDGKNDVTAFMWDTSQIDFKEGDSVKVKGTLGFYNDNPKIDVIDLSKSDQIVKIKLPSLSEDDIKDFTERFQTLRSKIEDEDFSNLLDAIFTESFWEIFISAPAAKSHHQAYLGGLLQHSVEVAESAYSAYKQYPENLNLSLLLTGALLHDVGKVKEYTFETSFDRSTTGKLIGHTTLGVIIITRMLPDDFPSKKFAEIVHLLLSHHGKRDWGAPVEPLMKEAVIIHHSDMINSYVGRFDQMKEKASGEWTEKDQTYNREWYIASTVENDDE